MEMSNCTQVQVELKVGKNISRIIAVLVVYSRSFEKSNG